MTQLISAQELFTGNHWISEAVIEITDGKITAIKKENYDHQNAFSIVVPALIDLPGNSIAANNKTYGEWTTNIADEMNFTLNLQFFRNH